MNVMTGLRTGKELKIMVMDRFKARSKGKMEWSTMMESMEMIEKMRQSSELNSGTRIKCSGDAKIQSTCFKHVMFDITASPR